MEQQQLAKHEADQELKDLVEKQIQLNKQLLTVTRERDIVKQELEALRDNLDVEALRSRIPGAAIRRRLSSTVDPQADHEFE